MLSLNISSIYFTMRVPVCREILFQACLCTTIRRGPLIWLTVKSQWSLRKH